MKKTLFVAAVALLCSTTAFADSGIRRAACGYLQITVTTLQTPTIPTKCGPNPSLVVIKAEAQAVRYRDDGTAPTASVGMPVAVADAPIYYEGSIPSLQFIAQTAGGVVDLLYYK